jgi:Mg2+/Co2+ transporter CorC
VLDLFGRVPHKGEKLDSGTVVISVEKVERTRVLEVLVTLRDIARPGAAA